MRDRGSPPQSLLKAPSAVVERVLISVQNRKAADLVGMTVSTP
jgi:hypothetical protein